MRGKPERDYSVEVHGGVGHAIVYLPDDVGVVAERERRESAIFRMRGLEKRNGEWINPGREHAPVTIHLRRVRAASGTFDDRGLARGDDFALL